MTSTAPLPAGTWTLDTSATTVTVAAKKLLAFTVPASLTVSSGTIDIADDGSISADVVADATSYASKNPKRNEHVVGPDFLDADNHPTIRFEARVDQSGVPAPTAAGTVTVKGRTAPISLAVSNIDIDGDTAGFDAVATIDRNDLGVDKLPSLIIGKHLDLSITAVATRAA